MIIGYGVDSNMLLSTKVIKEDHGTPYSRILESMNTGLTMSITTLVALLVLMILANSLVLRQIAGVLTIGLLSDLLNTWILNGNLLLWRLKE